MEQPIEATLTPEDARTDFLPKHLPKHFLKFEALAFKNMELISPDYGGGYWDFFTTDNGGFFIAPAGDDEMRIVVPTNGYTGTMSAQAAGVVATLFALNMLMWDTQDRSLADPYYKLRDYAADHPEAEAIYGAID